MPSSRNVFPFAALVALSLPTALAFAATPAPIPVTVAAPVTVARNHTSYTAHVDIALSRGQNAGYSNVTAPAGQTFIVQTISTYRQTETPVGSSVHCLLAASAGGSGFYSLPPAIADGSTFPGSSISLVIEVDPGTQLDANCFRTDTSSNDVVHLYVTGYLTPN